MIKNNITLSEALELAKPYDEGSHTKREFKRILDFNPQLNLSFKNQLTDEFLQAANERGLYFITNMQRRSVFCNEPTISLSYVGKERAPTISLTYPYYR